ncbi:hypothetical protein ACS0TY_021166 [Phlomoides rotata]
MNLLALSLFLSLYISMLCFTCLCCRKWRRCCITYQYQLQRTSSAPICGGSAFYILYHAHFYSVKLVTLHF